MLTKANISWGLIIKTRMDSKKCNIIAFGCDIQSPWMNRMSYSASLTIFGQSFNHFVLCSFFFLEEAFNGPCLHSSGYSKVVGLLSSVSRCREIAEVITKEIPWPQWQYLYDELLLCHLPFLPHKPSNTILHMIQSLLWRCVFARWTHPWTRLLEATFLLEREVNNDMILWLRLEKRKKKVKNKMVILVHGHMCEIWICFYLEPFQNICKRLWRRNICILQ